MGNDDLKKLILSRRARFIAAALAGAGLAADGACDSTPQVCLDIVSQGGAGGSGGSVGGGTSGGGTGGGTSGGGTGGGTSGGGTGGGGTGGAQPCLVPAAGTGGTSGGGTGGG